MKIYTKTGDGGDTSLFSGGRVRKYDGRVDTYGTVDELNSLLGVVRAEPLPALAAQWLERVQNDLFYLGADLATPLDSTSSRVVRIQADAVTFLEQAIDQMDEVVPPLQQFILPGGHRPAATLHVARTVCRRAERLCVALADSLEINPMALVYLNRLSDFLFTLARWVNLQAGENEQAWQVKPQQPSLE